MFSKPQIGAFACFVLSVSHLVRGRVLPDAPERLTRAIVRVVARASATCSSCAAVTVAVSGTLEVSPASTAVTVSVGFATSSASTSEITQSVSTGDTRSTASLAVASVTAPSPSAPSIASTSTIGNFGSCSIPEIEFGTGFDGRKETSFQPVNRTFYNHASAQTISTITLSICDTLTNSCGADATAKATCARAQSAANAAASGEGVDADIFNGFFDISTNFAAVPAVDEQGIVIGISTATSISVTSTVTVAGTTTNTASTSTSSSNTRPTSTTAASAATAGTSGNLQTFTGSLGGFTAPAVVTSGNQFQVEGNSLFNSKTEALSRSCDVQQNDCSNAANASGNKGGFTVTACGSQKTECDASNG